MNPGSTMKYQMKLKTLNHTTLLMTYLLQLMQLTEITVLSFLKISITSLNYQDSTSTLQHGSVVLHIPFSIAALYNLASSANVQPVPQDFCDVINDLSHLPVQLMHHQFPCFAVLEKPTLIQLEGLESK